MRSIRFLFAAMSFVVGLQSEALAQGLAGTWKAEYDSPIGFQKYTYDFKVDGDKVTGKVHGDVAGNKIEADVKEGKLKGNDVTFVAMLKLKDNEIRVEYVGKIKGDEINFTRKVGDFATADFVAKRVAPTAASAKSIAGRWKADFESAKGAAKYIYEFKVDGEKLTGKINGEIADAKFESDIKDGKVKGADVSFVETRSFNDKEIRIEYTGKVKGDEIHFSRQVGNIGAVQFIARPLAGDAAATKAPAKK